MIRRLVLAIIDWCERTGRVQEITGTHGQDDVYLIRYLVFRSALCNVYVHHFLRSDRDDMHDHPWDFFTYLVRGEYHEHKWDDGGVIITRRANWKSSTYLPKENLLVFRKATDQHRVMVLQSYTRTDRHLAPLSVCITGPRRREWGFWRESYEPEEVGGFFDHKTNAYRPVMQQRPVRRFVYWRTYLGLDR